MSLKTISLWVMRCFGSSKRLQNRKDKAFKSSINFPWCIIMLSLNAHVCPTAPCRDPGVPREGSRTGDDFRHGREVIFTCRGDYLMEGVREISCSNGAWSNRVPTCKGEGLHDKSVYAFLHNIEETVYHVINFLINNSTTRPNESAR